MKAVVLYGEATEMSKSLPIPICEAAKFPLLMGIPSLPGSTNVFTKPLQKAITAGAPLLALPAAGNDSASTTVEELPQ